MLPLFAAIRPNGIITIKRVNHAGGNNTVVAVIVPENGETYVLSISNNAVAFGYADEKTLTELVPPRGIWTFLNGGPHGGRYPAGMGYFCEKGNFATVDDALKTLKSILDQNCTLDTRHGYHGVDWPETLPSVAGSVNWP
jgi:hypothetical protein